RQVLKKLGDPYMIKGDDDPDVDRNKYGEVLDAPRVVKHLFDEIAPQYADRDGGYTRIIKLARHRLGDGGDLCVIQLVGEEEEGPQVRGQYSRRREKAHRRLEFAAQLRREAEGDAATATEEPPADTDEEVTEETATDTEATTEAPAEEAEEATEEAPAGEATDETDEAAEEASTEEEAEEESADDAEKAEEEAETGDDSADEVEEVKAEDQSAEEAEESDAAEEDDDEEEKY
ncbi:MAG: L17 family ribosomal protein, partial [Phycisphaeraceae bacterium]|nr:L17 family ribosomal protein [Phycisphaeraceae bacterium]